jgi:integrase
MPPKPTKKRAWNKGKIVGQKPPLNPEQVRTIRTLLSQRGVLRDIALFNLAVDSSLRSVDLLGLNVCDVQQLDLHTGAAIKNRITITQQKTGERVTFTLTDYTREALREYIENADKIYSDPLFSGIKGSSIGKRLSSIRYSQLVKNWVALAQLDPKLYGTHSLRRTRIAHIYKRTGNIRAAQVLLGHKSIENTAKYLGVDEDTALSIAEQFEI